MTDERAVEVIAKPLRHLGERFATNKATEALAALRAEGYDLYRPDDCQIILVEKFNEDRGIVIEKTVPEPPGRYCLVPVRGDS